MISDYKKYEDALDSMIELYVENTQHLLDNGYSCTQLMPLCISGIRQLGTTSYIMKRLRNIDFFITPRNMKDRIGLRHFNNVLAVSDNMFYKSRGCTFSHIPSNTDIFIYTDCLPKKYDASKIASDFFYHHSHLASRGVRVRVISLGSC